MSYGLFCFSNPQRRNHGWEVGDHLGSSHRVFACLVAVLKAEVIRF